MSDTPISGFAADTTPVAADLIVTAKSPFAPGSNKKVTWTNVFANAQPLLFPVASASAVSAASYWIGRDADGTNQLHFNVPTGASYEHSVNDVMVSQLNTSFSHVADDVYRSFGNTLAAPDAALGWNTVQTVDALYLGLPDAQNNFIIGEFGDRTFDFAHGASVNPTLFVHSAVQNTTQWVSLAHNKTNGIIATGAGDLTLSPAGGFVLVPTGVGMGVGNSLLTSILFETTAITFNNSGNARINIDTNNNQATAKLEIGYGTTAATGGTVLWSFFRNNGVFFTSDVKTSGIPNALSITGAAHTGITAATTAPAITLDFSATKTWAAGAGPLAAQSEVELKAPTYAGNAAGALTITRSATYSISGAPIQGANITLTNREALWIKADDIFLGAGRVYGGGVQLNHQTLAADTNLTLDENDGVVQVTTGAVSDNTITLPAASGNEGMVVSVYLVTDGGMNAVVTRAGADVIQNGSADLSNTTVTLDDAGDYVLLQCITSTMWQVVVNSGGTVA